ncbi:MAG: GldG family protein [Candidatus Marinimicrobia bacterium]|nr:GldG family protein [Candidatus Neomarinimicrobiota bacterium]
MDTIKNKKQFIIYIALVAVIAIILNVALRSIFFRIDLTKNNIYSLSESSKTILNKIDDRMVAKVFFSENLPGQYGNTKRYLQDLLEEYQAYSKGKFQFEFINPTDQETKQQARSYRISPVQMQVVENDEMQVKNVYMGMALLYNDKNETIPVIKSTKGLEYDITTAIKKLADKQMKTIGVVQSSNKINISVSNLSQFLRQTYRVRRVSLDKKVPGNINTLLINGIEDSLSTEKLYNLDQYLMRGGKLFIGQGRTIDQLNQGQGRLIKSNIYDLLEHYGLTIGRDLLIDKNCGRIQIRQKRGMFSFSNAIKYPPFIIINNMNKSNPIVQDLEQVRVFFTHELSAKDTTVNFVPLLRTSSNTGSIQAQRLRPNRRMMMQSGQMPATGMGYNLQPNLEEAGSSNPAMTSFPLNSTVISGFRQGPATSYFSDSLKYAEKEDFMKNNPNVEMLVITDNKFFNDDRGGGIEEDRKFILNGIDYLMGETELMKIRSREISASPLDDLSAGQKKMWKWLNILLPAVLVILLGVYHMKKRKDEQKLLEEIYG